MKAYSRCSNYLPVAVSGKNIAHEEKSHSQKTLSAALTALQETENSSKEVEERLKSLSTPSLKEIQLENIMFYKSKTKKEELERYQDCSWFQGKPSEEDSISKLSQAEDLISPNIEVNELDLGMQFANREASHWGDDYLEVFDDEDFHHELNEKFGEKENHLYPSNENNAYINHKLGDDGFSDLSIYNNYPIKKTDSYDNMKVITSTNLSDVIPMSYQEQVNINYNLQTFNKIKCEIKEELELPSPESEPYFMESDDIDLNVGREEVIEVDVLDDQDNERLNPAQVINFEKSVKENAIGEVQIDQQEFQHASCVGEDLVCPEYRIPVEELRNETGYDCLYDEDKKEFMKLEFAKNAFEQSFNASSPELDFMDLINYINNEMNPGCETSSQLFVEQQPMQNTTMPLKESSPNTVSVPSLQFPLEEGESGSAKESLPKCVAVTSEKVQTKRGNLNDFGTINQDDKDSMTIAERIKSGSSRKRQKRYSSENIEPSEDDENRNDSDEYDFELSHPRKRSRSSKSNNSESASSKCSGESYIIDTYRERRDKNNEASRRSRQNKKDKERQMYRCREEAESKNIVLKAKAEKLEKLVTYLRQLLLQLVLRKGSAT